MRELRVSAHAQEGILKKERYAEDRRRRKEGRGWTPRRQVQVVVFDGVLIGKKTSRRGCVLVLG